MAKRKSKSFLVLRASSLEDLSDMVDKEDPALVKVLTESVLSGLDNGTHPLRVRAIFDDEEYADLDFEGNTVEHMYAALIMYLPVLEKAEAYEECIRIKNALAGRSAGNSSQQ